MISQNRLRVIAMKNDFLTTGNKYKEALKYYGYSSDAFPLTSKPVVGLTNSIIYPMPVLKHTRTLMKQASLPRMPVPILNNSISKYLTAVKPFLDDVEFENTKKIALEFAKEGGIGEKLQKLLVEKSKKTENWLAQWWLDKIYLEPRYSVVINVNPGSIYPKANYKTLDEQLMFATKYILGFLDFKKFLEDQQLPTEKLGDANLCMDQYYKLFGTCRIPNKDIDLLKVMQVYNIDLKKSNHVTVLFKNRIFKLQIIDPQTGLSLDASEIYSNLKRLVDSTTENGVGLGIMTAENRDVWHEVYAELSKSETNKTNFESIQDSFFVLCLDQKEKFTNDQIDSRSFACGQMLHGNKEFTSNRWFDKTIQVIVGHEGVWGVNFEHSVAEAVPHSLMNDYIYKHILKNENIGLENISLNENSIRFRELNFEIPKRIEDVVLNSALSVNKQIDNLDLYVLNFDLFGKNFPKSQRLSPDAFVQIAMQLAFFRTHKKLGNAYESGSLRKYHLGRTEIIRACGSDSANFVRSMESNLTHQEKANLLKKAINAHRLNVTNVINCESFDRHLLGLKLVALENNIELPDLYKDVSFKRICHYYISSSQVSSKYEAVTSYGPAVDDGYGACYNIMENRILFAISSLNSCTETSSKFFGNNIQQALLDCQSLLLKLNSKL